LIKTSPTQKAWPEFRAHWLHKQVRARLDYIVLTDDGQQRRVNWSGLGLMILVALTAYAVSWVSIWWAPAYLVLIAFIFVIPRWQVRSDRASAARPESSRVISTHAGSNVRVDRAAEWEHHDLVSLLPLPAIDDSTAESAGFNSKSANTGTTKPRRGRSRMQNAAKPSSGSGPESTSVAWIRIGPGKFVRADADISGAAQAQSMSNIANATEVKDTPAAVTSTPQTVTTSLVGQEFLESVETTPSDKGMFVTAKERAFASDAEVHGITPTALSPAPLSDDGLKCDLDRGADATGTIHIPLANLGCIVSRDGVDPAHFRLQRRLYVRRTSRIPLRVVSAIPGVDRAFLRRNVRPGRRPSVLAWSPASPTVQRRQAAYRAFGRLSHVQRTLRPRSPPYRVYRISMASP
jgi:hypothetical protein